jgi:hypothetical protein
MKRKRISSRTQASAVVLVLGAIFAQAIGCMRDRSDPGTEGASPLASVPVCAAAEAVADDGQTASLSLQAQPDGTVKGSYVLHGAVDVMGAVDVAPEVVSWGTLPTGETTVGFAADPSKRVILESAHVLTTGGIEIVAKQLDGSHRTTIQLPDFDTSVLLMTPQGPGLQPQAVPLIGPVIAFCTANPAVCVIVGVAALVIVGAVWINCQHSVSAAFNACLAAGKCPAGGSCNIGFGSWGMGVNTVLPACNPCTAPVPAPTSTPVCPPTAPTSSPGTGSSGPSDPPDGDQF